MNRQTFQLIYIFAFFFMITGIVGNMELNVETPTYCWVITSITGFLTAGKFIYCKIMYRR